MPHPMRVMPLIALIASCGLLGCEKTDQKSAEQAQLDAQEKARDAQREANVKIAEAKLEAEKAAVKAADARAEVKTTLQKDVDAVDRKITYLKERGAAAKGNAQKNVAAAQSEVDTRRATVSSTFRKLETESGAAWDTARGEAESAVAALKSAVDSLENTLTAKPAK